MKHIEIRRCRRCGKEYIWEYGGFVSDIRDLADMGMCFKCRVLQVIGIFDRLKKEKES